MKKNDLRIIKYLDGMMTPAEKEVFESELWQRKELFKEYEEINNPVLLFAQNYGIENQAVADVYLKYSAWCRENGLSPVSNINFGRILGTKRLFKTAFRRIDGKSIRYYVKF